MARSNTHALTWQAPETPPELHDALRALSSAYPIAEGAGKGIRVAFEKTAQPDFCRVSRKGREAVVQYQRPAMAMRAAGALLAGIVPDNGSSEETSPFTTFGIMLDCSRNAVMTPEHFKGWLRQLALLGYNMAMLYTEDTYELPGEEYFGLLRGRYTEAELRDIDAYAARLGIEMIGCIQTLGHLEQILKWRAYDQVRDTASVLFAGREETYELIGKMIATCKRCFRSRRIHVGMDETHDLGRGRFMDLEGYRRGYDIFNRHLERVTQICSREGMQPMIWSDMYFRMGSKTMDYYDPACRIPDDVRQQIPRATQLVYWDYYHQDEAFYLDWIQRHRDLGFEPVMGSGVWTWGQFSYQHSVTVKSVTPCLRACRKSGLRQLFFTLWGDDGAFCEYDTALAGLAYGAELAHRGDGFPEEQLASRLRAVADMDYHTIVAAAGVNTIGSAAAVLWDDPLYGIYWNDQKLRAPEFWPQALDQATAFCRDLAPHARQRQPVDLEYICAVASCLREKIRFRLALDAAYAGRDPAALQQLRRQVPAVVRSIDAFLAAYRRQWNRRNKPFGVETLQIRLGGLKQRYQEVALRLDELAKGKIERIPELEQVPSRAVGVGGGWRSLASASCIL